MGRPLPANGTGMFQDQDSEQTLDEGLDEYRAINAGLLDARSLSPEAASFFRCHDAVHVVYGCGTSLADEAYVKICSIWGTTAGFRVLRGYRLHESREIYARLSVPEVMRGIGGAAISVPQAIACCMKQTARWPWDGFHEFGGVPLAELRRQFGIRVRRRS